MENIPFLPLPVPVAKKVSTPLKGFGVKLAKSFPNLQTQLDQAEIKISTKDYCSIMLLSFIIYFALFASLGSLILSKFVFSNTIIFGINILHYYLIGVVLGIIFGGLVFVQILAYPSIKIKKKVRAIDSNLIYALRTMLVELKSGVSLFDSLCMIAYSKRYGQLSKEIKNAVDNINSGVAEDIALKELGDNNPSPYLKKVLWQIVNGMHQGADVTDVLAESVSSITREQQTEIESYGNSLRILTLMYLMIGVIVPTLGLTFLIVMGSFPKIQITELTFWFMLGIVLISEFMFMGIIKSKRPGLMSN